MEKLKTTDKAGKTVEAWWALLFAEGSLGHSLWRWGWPVIGGIVGAWVASVTDWISSYGVAGWAATIMLGALGFVWLAVGIDHFRAGRTRRAEVSHAPELDYQPDTLDRVKAVTEGEVGEIVETRLAEFLATTLRAEFAKHSDLHAHDEKFVEIERQLKHVREIAEASDKAITARLAEIGDLIKRTQDYALTLHKEGEERFEWVNAGFRAIWHREMLADMESRIEEGATWLLRPRNGERIDNWGLWDHRKGEWDVLLNEWIVLGSRYRSDLRKKVMDVPHNRLRGEWEEPDDMFPNVDAITAYRAACIVFENYRTQRAMVARSTEAAAFHSPASRSPLTTDEDR